MIDGKVDRVLSRLGSREKSYGFLHMVLEKLFPKADEEIASLITDGGNDRGADAVHIRVDGGNAYISIIQCKYAQSVKNAGKNFPGSEVDKLISLITDIANKAEGVIDTVNLVLARKIEDIWRLVEGGKTIFIHVFFVSNTMPLVKLENQRFLAFCKQYGMISFEELSFSSIAALITSDGRPREDGVLDCIDLQKFERIDCDIRGLIANVDATSYISMITDEVNDAIKRHLLMRIFEDIWGLRVALIIKFRIAPFPTTIICFGI